MLITRKSMFSGIERTMDLDITQEQIDAHNSGMLIQNAFPNLTVSEREFFLTGTTDEEWNNMWVEEPEDYSPDEEGE